MSAGPFGFRKKPKKTTPATQQFANAVNSDNSMYNTIGSGYSNLYNDVNSNISGMFSRTVPDFEEFQYRPYEYKPTSEYTSAVSQLKNQAATGGFSSSDLEAIRARGISPIRSIYANANREMLRRNALSGGGAGNFGALAAKMAREQSAETAEAMDKVNAGIAERVAAGKSEGLSRLSSLVADENARKNTIGQQENEMLNKIGLSNLDLRNRKKTFEYELPNTRFSQMLEALNGMRSLYGTTPARSSLFGDQAMQEANLRNNIRNSNRTYKLNKSRLLQPSLG